MCMIRPRACSLNAQHTGGKKNVEARSRVCWTNRSVPMASNLRDSCILDWPHKADHFMRWQRGIACKQVNEVLGERQDALCFLCWSSSGQMGEAQASLPIGKYGESQLFKHTARGGCNPMAAYIGVDVSKHVLDGQMGAHYFQVENTAKGLKKFIRALEKCIQSGNPVSTVVCEASGGYERD